SGVIRLCPASSFRVHLRGYRIADSQAASFDPHSVKIKAVHHRVGVFHRRRYVVASHLSDVSDLSTGFGIERCSIEDDFAGLSGVKMIASFLTHYDGEPLAVASLGLLIPGELGLWQPLEERGINCLRLSRGGGAREGRRGLLLQFAQGRVELLVELFLRKI